MMNLGVADHKADISAIVRDNGGRITTQKNNTDLFFPFIKDKNAMET